MKKWMVAAAAGFLGAAAAAQSTLQIYGSLDAGVDHVSNAGGSGLWAVNAGRRSPDRFGFRGMEDLGNGLAAFFKLESGFNTDTGTSTRADTFFNRYAQVGLQHKSWGTVTLGHMPDFLYEYLAPVSNSVPGVSASFNPGNLDNLANQFQLDNAIKYETATIGGFQGGLMYGFGEAANSGSTNERYSIGAQYRRDALRVTAAYSMFHNRPADIRAIFGLTSLLGQNVAPGTTFAATRFSTRGLGGSYDIGIFSPHVLVTFVNLGNGAGRERLRNYSGGVNIDISGGKRVDLLGLSLSRSTFLDREFRYVNVFASHLLSKRTQVYVAANRLKAESTTAGLFGYARSTTGRQTVFRVGIQNQF